MNEWVVTTKLGNKVLFGNPNGWDDFLRNMVMLRACVAPGYYIPMEAIDMIQPNVQAAQLPPKSMAEVIHLVPPPKVTP
jgi:hypothetical protein